MQIYRLVFEEASDTLEFEAPNLAAALRLADDRIGNRPADIWQDGSRLARIRKAGSNSDVFWQVS